MIGSLAWSLVNFRLDLMRRMVAQGHRVTAIAPDFDDDVRARLACHGIDCRQVRMNRTGLNPLTDLRSLAQLVRTLRALKPDCVLSYTMKPIVYGSLAAQIAGVPTRFAMFTGLGYAFSEPRPTGRRRLVRGIVVALHRVALRKITGAFCYNAQERRDIRDFKLIPSATRLTDVPGSGVDTARFTPKTAAPGSQIRFLFVGRLLRSKGLVVLADATRRLRNRGHAFTLSVLGPMDTNPDAITAAELDAWQRGDVLQYLGETRDVAPYLAATDVFVLPTMLREGVPRTILEAMASGLPVITTDAPGCGETIEDGVSGLVVPAGDADALAAGMERFLTTPELVTQMGEAARERVCARNDVELINARLLVAMGLERPEGRDPKTHNDPRLESAA
ncbi:glycosyltransferase family 4 protein [Cognatishimia sp. MH4019]|uniref:glycosyltransferase family 4 protein n=1 Tax=Cognatishimia sp. MH4019 TaxID=2854030 RepID=UPI001CD30D30